MRVCGFQAYLLIKVLLFFAVDHQNMNELNCNAPNQFQIAVRTSEDIS